MSATLPIVCTTCGSEAWCACAPGTEAEPVRQGNVRALAPVSEVPMVAWCWGCSWFGRREVADERPND
jgi:hypothetical protein